VASRCGQHGEILERPYDLRVESRLLEPSHLVVDPVVQRAQAEIRVRVREPRGLQHRAVALAWLLHEPDVTAPIVGATKLEHVDDALAAEQLSLGDEEIARLEEPYVPHPVAGIEL
jgi:1-deoxyxylulose-5-phosphate synthase